MDRLHEKLVDNYGHFWARCRGAAGVTRRDSGVWSGWEASFGGLLDPIDPPGLVLDIGCGSGAFLEWLAHRQGKASCCGVDASSSQIARALEAHPDLVFHHRDGLDFLRAHPGRFAGIFCHHVLEHLPSEAILDDWLVAARSSLVPGGFFCCSSHNAANLTAMYTRYRDPTHRRLFTRDSLAFVLESSGFAGCRNVQLHETRWLRRLRDSAQWLFHKGFFLLCGQGHEQVFSPHITVVGFSRGERS